MNWRDVLVGSVATLVVTILGGVGVYYLTKEKPVEKSERLVYRIEDNGQFSGKEHSIGVVTIHIENAGQETAANVTTRIWFGADLISDHKLIYPSGDESRIHFNQVSPKELSFTLQRLFPGEGLKIAILTGASSAQPNVSLHSDASVGKRLNETEQLLAKLENKDSSSVVWSFAVGIAVPIGAALSVMFINRLMRKALKKHVGRSSSLNNIGFCLLHSGGTQEARNLLEDAVRNADDAPHCMANFALATGLLGDLDTANRWMKAAEFYARTDHEKAVVQFNQGILLFHSGANEDCYNAFAKAIAASPSEILDYAKFSSLVQSLIESDEKLKRILIAGEK